MVRAFRVLVADDDAIVADTLAQVLKTQGIEAYAVHSGNEAVAVAKSLRPDAAILDVILHDLNGIETALAILRELPSCRIVLFSGNQETPALLAKAALAGPIFNAFPKPVHPLELIEALGPIPLRAPATQL